MPQRTKASFVVAFLAMAVAACGSSGTPSTSPAASTSSGVAKASPPTPSPSLSPAPTATPSPACTGSELNAVMGAGNAAAGGEQAMTVVLADQSSKPCLLSGDLPAQLLDSSGNELNTSWSSTANGQAWLAPDRVALDPWWPQAGEATLVVRWHTGDIQPGQCSGAAPQVGEVRFTAPGGGSVIANLGLESGVAPCKGVIVLGPITQATAPQAYLTPTAGAEAAAGEEFPLATGVSSYQVKSGNQAAYVMYSVQYVSSGCGGTTYLWQDAAGWHVLDSVCVQNGGYNPLIGEPISIFGAGSGCAEVYASPGHGSSPIACLSWSEAGLGTTYTVDQGPTYVAETDPTSQVQDGTIWWHLQAIGWVSQDFLVGT